MTIKVLREPLVELVIKPQIQWGHLDCFLEENYNTEFKLEGPREEYSDGDIIPMACGKACYKAWGVGRKDPKEYLKHIIESGHGSVLEHAVYGFIFVTTRAITHEIVRHRAGFAFSQESQRFCDERENAFIMPYSIQGQVQSEDLWREAMESAQASYIQLVDVLMKRYKDNPEYKDLNPTDLRKKVREAARGVLPNDTASVIHVTANVRGWRHFIEMRASRHAEVGIRMVANQVYDCLASACPILFGDYVEATLPDGTFELTTPFSKV
jgi:thymidylate synthase (FAD)